jgi:glycosyltransferase involved in cell wall biosynthesis
VTTTTGSADREPLTAPSALWVTAIPPDRHGGGGHIRQAYLLDALASRAKVTLIVAGELRDDVTRAAMQAVVEISADPRTPPTGRLSAKAWSLRQALLEPYPGEVTQQRGIRRALAPAVKMHQSRADLVFVETIGMAPLVDHPHSNRWFLNLHNVPSTMAAHEASVTSQARVRWFLRREKAKGRRLERRVARSFDGVIAVSERDATSVPGAIVVPNGVDIKRFSTSPLPSAPRIVLTGALYTRPNADGAMWFVRDVLPLIRRRVPEARLDLVGLRPGSDVRALAAEPDVALHADVPDVRPFLERARVAVVPLRIGTGTRLKALEAMAAGRPVVGTSIGLGGLLITPNVHALVADGAAAFADAVVRLLTGDRAAAELIRRARQLVEAEYSWSVIGARFTDLTLTPR